MRFYKNLLLASLFVVITCSISEAQDLYLGLKGGTHLTGLNYDGASGFDISQIVGWNAGMVACYQPAGSRFGASLELGYLRKGASINDTLDYRLHYVGGPILFDFYLTERIKLSAGPEISILTDAKNLVNDSTTVDITSDFGNQFELGGTFGASFSLTFFMDVGVRYNMSFTEIADFDPRTEAANIRTDYVQIFLLLKVAN